jgi:hypothetical protein
MNYYCEKCPPILKGGRLNGEKETFHPHQRTRRWISKFVRHKGKMGSTFVKGHGRSIGKYEIITWITKCT